MESQGLKLRKLIGKGHILVLPGAHSGLYAKIMQQLGFEALYMSGGQCNYSHGLPDLNLRSMEEILRDVYEIASAVDIPVLADADTGYGNPLNVWRTVQAFEAAGAAALHIEDQPEELKRSGSMKGVRLISTEDMVAKVKAAVDARRDDEFMIFVRTDAIAVEGIDRAIERMQVYIDAGADGALVLGPESIEQYVRIPKEIEVPNIAIMSRTTLARTFSLSQLEEWGWSICIMPVDPLLWAAQAVVDRMNEFRATGRIDNMLNLEMRNRDLQHILETDAWLALQ